MVPFAGWEMPVQYPAGILAEHTGGADGRRGVRRVAHGRVRGHRAGPQRLRQPGHLQRRRARWTRAAVQYSALLNAEGTFVDDCTVYRFDDRLMIVVNASNRAKAWEHIVDQKQAGGANVRLRDISDETGLLAVQGPKPQALLQPLAEPRARDHRLLPLRRRARSPAIQCFVSRTGYTGEDGFEVYCRWRDTVALWEAVTPGRGRADRAGRPRLAAARDGLCALRPGDRRHHHPARGRASAGSSSSTRAPRSGAARRSARRRSAG